jgi:hypothetical protein
LALPSSLLPLLCALVSGALAGTEPEASGDPVVLAAEHQRLSGELEQLARRQVWTGLEDKFRQLEALGVQLSFEDLVHGAWSARALGDVQSTYQRLQAAVALQQDDELLGWLRSIDAEYGQVVLCTSPLRGVELEAQALPFAPDRRAAVEHASVVLAREGYFAGRLPTGSYQLSGTPFEVEPGVSLRIEVSTRRRDRREEQER